VTLRTVLMTSALLAFAGHATAGAQTPPSSGPRVTSVGINVSKRTVCGDSARAARDACKGTSRFIADNGARIAQRDNSVRKGMLYGATVGALGGAIIGAAIADPNPRVVFSSREAGAVLGGLLGSVVGMTVGGVVGAFTRLER
jgi:hypothetical protein